MAEIKNSFLRSKMNQDLDDRLIPNGEYRDANNISVGKSEADDIGALENVKGNFFKTSFGLSNTALRIIGYYSDEPNNRFIVFLTDYNDTGANPTLPPLNNNCYIYQFTPANNSATLLVSGIFLNFSISNPITGVDLIEDLLFFTDNRNQPRKINLKTALNSSGYYSQESDISVAKYNPYQGISLLNKVVKTTTTAATTNTIALTDTSLITKGMSVVQYGNSAIQPEDYIYVTAVTTNTSVTINKSIPVLARDVYFLSSTMTGEEITFDFNGGVDWPGDPNYLQDKFVRFSYRFRFDDGEYSLMAPFTQIGFIPKQKGYFLEGGENAAYRSTIVEFMENGVQDIRLKIPLPDVQANLGISSSSTYKIIAIDILYKESDALAIKSLETIELENIGNSTTENTYIYRYQSRKPFKTLPTDQTVRVYDKVPVKAFSQAVYGNFLDKYTSPQLLNYRVGVTAKSTSGIGFDNWAEYPTHSLKQNRNYQVGFVLADKYGRQSDVILSNVDATIETNGGIIYGGSTIYAPYNTTNTNPNIKDWFGDALRVIINSPGIQSGLNGNPSTSGDTNGQPGLYANPIANGFDISGTTPTVNTPTTIPVLNVSGFKYEFTAVTGGTVVANWGTRVGVASTCQTQCCIDMAATLVITNGGTGYAVTGTLPTQTLTGIGSGMRVNILSVDGNGAITGIEVGGVGSSGGIYYFENDTIEVTQLGGSGSIITITANTGTLANIQVDDIITTSIVADAHLNGAVVTAIQKPGIVACSPLAAWAVKIDKPTSPGYAGPQGGTPTTYPLTFTRPGSGAPAGIPVVGSFLRGEYTDYVEIVEISVTGSVYSIYTEKPINESIYSLSVPAVTPDTKFAYKINPEGWYSYKVVVKQTQQDYYNAYLPGILAGYPGQPLPTNTTQNSAITNSYNWDIINGNNCIQIGMVADGGGGNNTITGNPSIVQKIDSIHYVLSSEQTVNVNSAITYRMPGELSLFPLGEIGKTANVVLINDNINKIPRDLAEVGPDQKQFRSSVQLFGRVTNSNINSNIQYFPGTITDTVVSISTASDSNFTTNTILEQNYTNIYQLDTNPLIARIETTTKKTTIANTVGNAAGGINTTWEIDAAPTVPVEVNMIITNNDPNSDEYQSAYGYVIEILTTTTFKVNAAVPDVQAIPSGTAIKFTSTIGVPSGRNRTSFTGGENGSIMEPFLAVYETEAVESLLDIFWETDTVGLINDLNEAITGTFTGATGWSSYTWLQPESLASGGEIFTNLFPKDSIGNNLTNTRLVNSSGTVENFVTAIANNGTVVNITLEPTVANYGVGWNGSYKAVTSDTFVFLYDESIRNFRISPNVKNLITGEISGVLELNGSLTNIAPVFTIPANPLVISGTTTGIVETYSGTNGSASTSNNQDQLRWSIVAGGTGDLFFSINESTGALTKTVSSVLAGTYTLNIKLEDTWNGTSSSSDAKSLTLVQNFTINNTTSGFQFAASPPGTLSQSCSVLPANPLCGDNFYYNATPQVGDIIRQGPGNNAPFATEGTYSYNCTQSGQNNRHYFQIVKLFGESDDGVVDVVDVC